jgi:hypothetical protein
MKSNDCNKKDACQYAYKVYQQRDRFIKSYKLGRGNGERCRFEKEHFELLRDILARIGFADVREFGLSWDDCHDYLHRLGYDVRVEVSETI